MTSPESKPTASKTKLLYNSNFVLLWCAYGISVMGDHLSEMAILKTQDAVNPNVDITPLTARMTFTFFVPFFLLAPLAGVVADRLPRRAVMIVADIARCAIMIGFATLIALTQDWGPWGPFLPLAMVGMFAGFFSPARSALLPTLIRPNQLVRANGMIAGLGFIATTAAIWISGYLAEHHDPRIAFRLDAGTFLLSAAFLAFIRLQKPRYAAALSRPERSSFQELLAGFSYARAHRRVLELLVIAGLLWFCAGVVNTVIPAVVRDVYHGSYQTMSTYRLYLMIGLVLGGGIIATLGDALRSEIAITWGLLGISMGVAIFALSVFLPLEPQVLGRIGAVGVLLAGMFGTGVIASFNSLLQRTVADRYRGRVFGVRDIWAIGALLIATGFLGVPRWTDVDRWVGYILLAVAIMTFAAGLITLTVRLGRGELPRKLTILENLNEFLARFWWRLQRLGRSTVPREGAVIITANHTCSADPLFLSAAARYRPMSFMVAEEYTTWPIVRHIQQAVECIPVKRDGQDTTATKRAIRHLRAGKALCIFIEGGITAPWETAEPRDGVAMLALKTNTPVIPAHISGVTYHSSIIRGLISRHRARVRFGAPVDLSEYRTAARSRENTRAATREIYTAINALALQEPAST